jgi:hypothetical protein
MAQSACRGLDEVRLGLLGREALTHQPIHHANEGGLRPVIPQAFQRIDLSLGRGGDHDVVALVGERISRRRQPELLPGP